MAYTLNHSWSSGETITTARMQSLEDSVYDTHYANAGAHNSIYRGKQIGTSLNSTYAGYISGGTFYNLFIGDYWTISGTNYHIGAFDYYYKCGFSASLTTHHAAMIPAGSLYSAPMNSTATASGAYVGSAMYTCEEITVESTTYTGLTNAISTITSAFGSYVLEYETYLNNAVTNGYHSGGEWVTGRTCDLMTEHMVYSGPVRLQMSAGGTSVALVRAEKSQLPIFAMNPTMINIRASYWLRDVVSASNFACASTAGSAASNSATISIVVRPCFLIS